MVAVPGQHIWAAPCPEEERFFFFFYPHVWLSLRKEETFSRLPPAYLPSYFIDLNLVTCSFLNQSLAKEMEWPFDQSGPLLGLE